MIRRKRPEKNSRSVRKALLTAILIISVIAVTVGGTIAYLIDKTSTVKNEFTPSFVTTKVVEKSAADGTVTEARIANTNNTQAYIRAAVSITWKNDAGEIYAIAPTANDYTINWVGINDGSWVLGSDGYYYHTEPVDPVPENGTPYTTSVLFTDAAVSDSANIPEGFSLSIEVLGSGIQSTPEYVVVDNWGVTMNGTSISK